MVMTASTLQTPSDEQWSRAILEERAPSVGALFRDRVSATPNDIAFRYPEIGPSGDTWHEVTWREVDERVRRLAAGLIALDIQSQQRVAIASNTRYEWALVDLAVMCAGAATTTVYPTTHAADVAFILADSASIVAFVEDNAQREKVLGIRDQVPSLRRIVVIDGDAADGVTTLADLEKEGAAYLEEHPTCVDERIDGSRPEHLATLIYTSGTTGRPKGVRLLQRTWIYQGASTHAMGIIGPDDVCYLWLPLSHVFGKLFLTTNLKIGYPTALDGRLDKIVPNMAVIKPTWMPSAPRIFEKAHAGVVMMMEKEGGIKLTLFTWACAVGVKMATVMEEGRRPNPLLAAQYAIADKLVLSKIRERFGGRIRFFISGSAALNQDIARWFYGVGMPVAEGYGLTESSAASFVNRLDAWKVGSVGWVNPGGQVKIAEDGEILLRGDGIMDGYQNNPEATAEALDGQGWLHTGDIGEIDARGFLRITDRKKDLFKTSGGKYVAPSVIESTFKGICPFANQLIVYGDGRNFVSALVTLDADAMAGWAAANGLGGRPYEEVVASDACREMVQGYIDELNAGLNRWETIKKFAILDHDLTVENGELTPSLKLKRKVVVESQQATLDSFYTA